MTPNPVVHQIADYQNRCGECPVWDAEAGVLYWTDNVQPRLYRYEPATGQSGLFQDQFVVVAFRLNRRGGFVIANGDGIFVWDGIDEPRLICGSVGGSRCQINEGTADPAGRFLAGSCFYDPRREYELGKLFQIDRDGTARILDEGFHIANGMGFSLDGSTLYVTDSGTRTIYSYAYNTQSGAVGKRRVFVHVPRDEGLPDGLCVDSAGYVWSAQWYGSCIVRYDPDGTVERRIATPAKQTSSLCFGGPDLSDIYITSAGVLESSPLMPPGFDPDSGCIGGALYGVHTGIRGKREPLADVTLRS